MAFRADKQTDARLDELQQRLTSEKADVDAAVEEYQQTVEAAREKLEGALDTYNGVVTEAQGVIEDFVSEMQGQWDEKSERWQDSERGQEVQDWITTLEQSQNDFEPVEMPDAPDLSLEIPDHPGCIDELERECPAG